MNYSFAEQKHAFNAHVDEMQRPSAVKPLHQRFNDANALAHAQFPSDGTAALIQLCNQLISVRENCWQPLKYASLIVYSIFDNADMDLCSIVPRFDREHEELTQKISCLIGFDSPSFKVSCFE